MMNTNSKWKLRACRAQAGFSQREVAEFMGCSEKSVVDWENGYSSMTIERGQKLSELYEVPINMMDFSKEGNKCLSEMERKTILARKMEPDTVTVPQGVDSTDWM